MKMLSRPLAGSNIAIRERGHGVEAGSKAHRWTILGCQFQVTRGTWRAVARCECGTVRVVYVSSVVNDSTCGSCGCVRQTHGNAVGKNFPPLYRVWRSMKCRCANKNNRYYGGRGIRVCEAWMKFEAFEKWALAHGYSDGLSIDRIDPDGNYEPDNCQWLTQDANRRKRRPNGTVLLEQVA